MKEAFNIEERKPIWFALSEFYLDTELSDADLRHIAFAILDSPYSFDEVKRINKYEIFPVLQPNLLSPAGAWAGFDEEWLVEAITSRLNSKNVLNEAGLEVSYQALKWMCSSYWQRLEKIHDEILANPDSYIVTCRAAYIAGIFPFQFEKRQELLYRKLYKIALDYRDNTRLKEYCQFLKEDQYYLDIWTAYFLLELFELDNTIRVEGLNIRESIFDYCYKMIENTFQSFKDKSQVKNCSYWLEEKRRATSALNSDSV